MVKKSLTVVRDNTRLIPQAIDALASNRVMIGVPATTASRKDTEGQPINNATLMYIHENGAPEANIPARPVLHPAAQSIQPQIARMLKQAGKFALDGNMVGALHQLQAIGLLGQNAMRERITEGPFAPLSPKTIAARAAKRGTKRRKGEQKYLDLVAGGMAPAQAQTAAGIRPLIDTGQLRTALTYVIRQVSWRGRR